MQQREFSKLNATMKEEVKKIESNTTMMATTTTTNHKAIVLFYKYFISNEMPELFRNHKDYYVEQLYDFQRKLCQELQLKGRILLAQEGINGTVSALNENIMRQYINAMENFDIIQDCSLPPGVVVLSLSKMEVQSTTNNDINDDNDDDNNNSTTNNNDNHNYSNKNNGKIFQGVDWKQSSAGNDDNDNTNNNNNNDSNDLEPFPDLKISIVKEIVSSGGIVSVDELPENTGKHLSPQEFHKVLSEKQDKDVVLIDVRNTFEHDIGHFVDPKTGTVAMNPEMVTFSSFDSMFCAKQADQLRDKKVLMYCTGGIRCEKASVMLKKRGVQDVNQLQGGIHRYLQEFGNDGYFKGLNFVFDQRVAMKPSNVEPQKDVVGKCVECNVSFDEICGSRVCTVCCDLVLVCPTCQSKLKEYHCRRHASWKDCYFTFLNCFNVNELQLQYSKLQSLRESLTTTNKNNKKNVKNVRRTLTRQMEKVNQQIMITINLQSETTNNNNNNNIQETENAKIRYCRKCMEPNTICDGLCWGFWKTKSSQGAKRIISNNSIIIIDSNSLEPILPIAVGDIVQPGKDWNILRLGSKINNSTGKIKQGVVMEIKSWSRSFHSDCVAVQWNDNDNNNTNKKRNQPKIQPEIYKWGVVALNGCRLYDVERVHDTTTTTNNNNKDESETRDK